MSPISINHLNFSWICLTLTAQFHGLYSIRLSIGRWARICKPVIHFHPMGPSHHATMHSRSFAKWAYLKGMWICWFLLGHGHELRNLFDFFAYSCAKNRPSVNLPSSFWTQFVEQANQFATLSPSKPTYLNIWLHFWRQQMQTWPRFDFN